MVYFKPKFLLTSIVRNTRRPNSNLPVRNRLWPQRNETSGQALAAKKIVVKLRFQDFSAHSARYYVVSCYQFFPSVFVKFRDASGLVVTLLGGKREGKLSRLRLEYPDSSCHMIKLAIKMKLAPLAEMREALIRLFGDQRINQESPFLSK